ncbi:AAA family ATPase [Haloferax sulfurifontis]|uniref:Methanol dehydrogenase regulatory protein n=2 Tax=Haloferax sulfurifontis TaxID=255616 RepID=M0HZL3_9EURY|nr:AAA family ATPase [Haloferax sulfurifontis]ELZ89198.1 methanol dehydrogenase regulatory protein [Haloferax sulfurifontis ATCC BAA-897]GGC69235.1 MoxR-like ATPase [Haloferax sulfurifontis]
MTDAHADADFDSAPSVEAVSDLATRISENVERVIVGHHDAIEDIIVALFARGHLLLEDVPGVGKTMLARAIATSIEGSFERIQFTPDLLPSDVTGVNVFNQQTSEFEFREGPVFGNVVLGDEINRAPPKTQAALLEVMEELQVTVDGVTRRVPDPFTVIATQNDVEPDRTYDLPLAELDRFMKKIHLGYPNEAEETELLGRVSGHHPIESLEPVASAGDVRDARERILDVTVSEPVRRYVSRLAADTRARADLGVSPRGSIALVRAAQARAALDARDYVVPDDVQREVRSVWAHRVRTTDERSGRDVVERALDTVAVE